MDTWTFSLSLLLIDGLHQDMCVSQGNPTVFPPITMPMMASGEREREREREGERDGRYIQLRGAISCVQGTQIGFGDVMRKMPLCVLWAGPGVPSLYFFIKKS